MRPFLNALALFVILTFVQSCTKVIEIDLPPADSKVVVNSFFTDGNPIKVHLSKSIGILDNIIPECDSAAVILLVNNVPTDTLYQENGFYYSHIPAEAGKKYSLIVHVPDMDSVLCEDIIPEKTILQNYVCTDSVLIDQDGFIINELKLDFDDFPGPSFYEVQLSANYISDNNFTSIWFKNNSDPIITSTGLLDYNPKTLIFTDKMFDGKHCSVKIYFATQTYADYNLQITFRSVSESYFKYKEKQIAYLFRLENSIFSGMSEPVNLYSNIKGGYGIFAGYSTDEKIITVAGK
ncbi:MAG: DUF4249 domain-containing protein [Bacteroidales bacterium]|nr:DUF4249 domain-containing protein [Bacteroidales bacterium]